jgi:phosphocarrier protein
MIQKNGSMSNAKSVLSVLGACVKNGDQVTIACEGPDEEAALAHIVELIRSGLGE